MTEEKVKPETALLAMSLGFNEQCTYYYDENYNLRTFTGYSIMMKYNTNKELHKVEAFLEDGLVMINIHCTAPRQALLQKWLRDIHNIRISIIDGSTITSKEPKYYSSINTETKWLPDWSINKKDVDRTNYELTLENTLLAALQLLKDIKK